MSLHDMTCEQIKWWWWWTAKKPLKRR